MRILDNFIVAEEKVAKLPSKRFLPATFPSNKTFCLELIV